MQSKRSPFQNPEPNPRGQISSFYSSSPFLFDLSDCSSIKQSDNLSQKKQTKSSINEPKITMNSSNVDIGISTSENGKESSFDNTFASPALAVPATGKPAAMPASSSGLSKPRLVKLRRQFVSHRGKSSTPVLESKDDLGFNPFRSKSAVSNSSDAVSNSSDGVNDGKMQALDDGSHGSNPFSSDSLQKIKLDYSSNAPNSDNFEYGKFGCSSTGSASNLNVKSNGSVGTLLPDRMSKFSFQGSAAFQSTDNASLNFTAAGLGPSSSNMSEYSDNVPFIFGSSAKKNSFLGPNADVGIHGNFPSKQLQDEMKKLNIDNLETSSPKSDVFVFGSGGKKSSVQSSSEQLPSEMKKLNITDSETSNSNSGDVCGKGVFVFGSSLKKNSIPNSSAGFDESVATILPDEMNRLNIEEPGNHEGVEKEKGIHSSFVFGNSIKKSSVPNSSAGFNKNVVTKLPDEMSKLNIQGPGNHEGLEKKKCIDSGFIFGSSVKKNSFPNSSSDFDESLVTKLPDDMCKLNIERPGNHESLEKKKGVDYGFVFGSSVKKNSVPNSSAGFDENVVTKLPDEMTKLNIEGSGNREGLEKKKGIDSGFVFGSSVKKNTIPNSSAGLEESMATELPDEMRTLNMEGSRNAEGAEKKNSIDPGLKANDNLSFVFGSKKNETGSFSRSTTLVPPKEKTELKTELHTGTRTGDSSGTVDMLFSSSRTSASDGQPGNSVDKTFSDPTANSYTPMSFTFQAGMQGHSSGMGQDTFFQQKGEQGVAGSFSSSSSLTSSDFVPQSAGNDFGASTTDKVESKAEFSFTSRGEGLGKFYMDPGPSRQDMSWMFFTRLQPSVEFTSKRVPAKEKKPMKRKGKLKQSGSVHQQGAKDFMSTDKIYPENSELDSPGSYSPMDFSPYQETLVVDQWSRETSMGSEDSVHANHAFTETQQSFPLDARYQDLSAATQCLNINKDDVKWERFNENGSAAQPAACIADELFFGHGVAGPGQEGLTSQTEKTDTKDEAPSAAVKSQAGIFSSNVEAQVGAGETVSCSAVGSEDIDKTNFTFTSTPSHGPLSDARRKYRKKNRLKTSQDSYTATPNANIHLASSSVQFFPVSSGSAQYGPSQSQQGGSLFSQSEAPKQPEVMYESISTTTATAAAREACEKWRLRGNQAYANGHLSKAEGYYTRGVNCVSLNETSSSCLRALMLCYSNRAATRISLGRMREALGDCMVAITLDPNFLKVQVRAANCHLALGEIEDALRYFSQCLQLRNDPSVDQKVITEASEGLDKAQQLAEYMDQSVELLQQKISSDAETALQMINEALLISPYSEKLVEMKAEALLTLRKYEDVVQLCEQTLDSAERNSVSCDDDQLKDVGGSESTVGSSARLWRWRLISRSYFYLGRLEDALDLLQKYEQVAPTIEKCGSKSPESSVSFSATVRELLHHKTAGNEAFQLGKHLEAVEHYTAALACNTESRPFAAICFCNRAAAHQALGQITDAIADCSLAIALDSNYPKAISRRATLHELIRDYGQAINDLQRLVSLLEKQTEDSATQGKLRKSVSSVNDLRQARVRLATMEEEAKKGISLDMYLILGIEPSSTASDIKKAYRKAALRHHPDKAGQFLVRTENGDDGLWKEIANEVHRDADRLFKMIGEAYAVLSDPTKRLRYDAEEEMRNAQKKGNGYGTARSPGDVHSHPFEQSTNRRQWRDSWKSYGNSQQRWSETSRSNRYY